MSHAYGKARFQDGEILHFEYNGTSDMCCRSLKRTPSEVQKDWRSERNQCHCECGHAPEPCRLYTDYGDGHHWDGSACRRCMAIVDGAWPLDSEEEEIRYEDGRPDWANTTTQATRPAPQNDENKN